MASRILRRAIAASLTLALTLGPQAASGAPLRSSYYPNWDGNGCRNIVPSQIEWQCQAGAAMTTTTNQQYVYESVTLSVSTISHYAPWSGSLQIIDVADSSQDCIVSVPAAAGTWECDISGAIGSELDIQLATSSPGVEIVQLAFAPLNQPTATPTDTATATGQPTATSTNTVVPGSTSTPIPTNTPRPIKTAIATDTGTPVPPTPTPTSSTPGEYDCGPAAYPVLNCNMVPYVWPSSQAIPPPYWDISNTGCGGGTFATASSRPPGNPAGWYNYGGDAAVAITYGTGGCSGTNYMAGSQNVSAQTAGTLYGSVSGAWYTSPCSTQWFASVSGSGTWVSLSSSSVEIGHVAAGSSVFSLMSELQISNYGGCSNFYGGYGYGSGGTLSLTFVTDSPWTPAPSPTAPTLTPTPGTPTETPLPLPFDTGTAIATGTPCPGGCAVGEATSLPGAIDTVLPIDTSPLSPLEHLSVSRTACQTFGSAPILVPSIHGTPVFGSTEPLSITWSLPVTGTTFTPCADPAFSTTWWDLMWHLSVIVTFVAFLSWLIWYVRRLFT